MRRVIALLILTSPTCFAADYSVRIIGGNTADSNEWPTMVQLMQETPDGTTFNCGGTLISDSWVLTAAHCFQNVSGTALDTSIAGRSVFVKSPGNLAEGDQIAMRNVFVHQDYDVASDDADIALVELEQAIVNPELQVLYSGSSCVGCDATILGWGLTSNDANAQASDTLNEAIVPTISQSACNTAMDNQITDNMMCAGFAIGRVDSCAGDSGGPLLIVQDGEYRQAGITSWGPSVCGESGQYGVYTRVSNYVDWIMGTTGLTSFAPTPEEQSLPSIPEDTNSVASSGGGSFAASLFALMGLWRLKRTV